MKFDPERFEAFLKLLPRDTGAAARLARNHSAWLNGRADSRSHGNRPVRHAVEIRNPSFDHPHFYELLRRHSAALVLADSAGKWPYLERLTANFVYVRLHGVGKMYVGGYDDAVLEEWALEICGWKARGRDVYVYFDNDVKVRAPFDAMELLKLTTKFMPAVLLPRKPLSRAA